MKCPLLNLYTSVGAYFTKFLIFVNFICLSLGKKFTFADETVLMNNKTWLCLGLLAAFFISGCGRQNSPLVDTVKLAVTDQPDVTVAAEKVAAIPYASAYL